MRLLARSRPPRSVAAPLQAARRVGGTEEGLAALREAGVQLAFGTAAPRARVELEMRANGLEGAFDALVFGDEVPHSKPDPAPVQLAARYLRVQPADLVLVGDADDDMAMARRAGATAVGVLTGAAERGRLRKSGAHWVGPTVAAAVAGAA